MYRKNDSTWLKHWDFIILDLVMFQVAYVISYMIRMGFQNPYKNKLYLTIGVVICVVDICVAFFTEPYHGIMRRGYFLEFNNVLRQVFIVSVLEVCYLFLTQSGEAFSRLSFIWFIIVAVLLLYIERIVWKHYLVHHKQLFYDKVKMVLLTRREEAKELVRNLKWNSCSEYDIVGIAYAGEIPKENEVVEGIPVVCSAEKLIEYIQTKWVDAVFVRVEDRTLLPKGILEAFIDMGITVHNCLKDIDGSAGNQYLNRMGGYNVLTSSVRMVSSRQLFLKRVLDICGGLVGLLLTGILTLFLGPAIYLASPGPIFFSQIRVGRNGKRFKIYKFRSMYMNAEERKKELMERNEMQGLMFKIAADPRIIGSGSDGTKHGLGWFIRKTSLDEFPQFWNVLKGDMSLVGTRPPTEDEWQQYEPSHRARLAVKPGLTGIWQVSGRSDITDFEEVVKLDMQYVKNWNIGMDIRILLKTVGVVLTGSGSH